VSTEGIVEVGDTSLVSAIGHVDGVLSMFFYAPILDAKWATSDPSVARLEVPAPPPDTTRARIVVRGVSPGTVSVTATSLGVTGAATVRVIPRLRDLVVLTSADTIAVGDSVVLRVDGVAEDGEPVVGLPARLGQSGGIYPTSRDGKSLLVGTEPGPASVDASFHRVSARKELVVVARSP
jgi:hypothetical protein